MVVEFISKMSGYYERFSDILSSWVGKTGGGRPTQDEPSSLFSVYLECGESGKRLALALRGADEFGLHAIGMVVRDRHDWKSLATGKMSRMTTYDVFFRAENPIDLPTFLAFMERIGCKKDHPIDFWD